MDLVHGNSSNFSANLASHGNRGGNNSRGGRNGGGRGRGGFGRGHGNGRPGGNGDRPVCQLCGKEGHTVIKCYKRFDHSFTGAPKQKSVSSATTGYGVDTNWYITGDLEKLIVRDEYSGTDQIHMASRAGMKIHQLGQSTSYTPDHNLLLNKVLYAPEAHLISVHRFTNGNNTFLEFHPNFFLVKDQETKRVLLRGRCKGGLYPFESSPSSKQMFGATKCSTSRWHDRLGHP
jgi:histone deacetylase 1/2